MSNYQLIRTSAHDTGLSANTVDAVVTSPPYFGLRAYAGEQGIEWPAVEYSPMPGLPPLCIPAIRCELGLEPTPEMYIGHLILVMREMWRVLKPHGTAWVNLGDSYNGSGGAGGDYGVGGLKEGQPKYPGRKVSALKGKDLIGIPWRFAFAAQADGWWLRSDCIWQKLNPMPESVTDRPTKAHEYIFLLAKSEKYFYDADAVKENATSEAKVCGRKNDTSRNDSDRTGIIRGDGVSRNRRSVWTVATSPYSGAHFACWPQDLVEPMIKASTSAHGVCGVCGMPWERVVERESLKRNDLPKNHPAYRPGFYTNGKAGDPQSPGPGQAFSTSITTGWQPTCTCSAEPVPATVLDPFSGSGTTGRVALKLGRDYIGCDVSEQYLTELAPERMSKIQMELLR